MRTFAGPSVAEWRLRPFLGAFVIAGAISCPSSFAASQPLTQVHSTRLPAIVAVFADASPPGNAGTGKQDSKEKSIDWTKVGIAFVIVFCSSLVIGGAVGKARSPKFDSGTDIARYVAVNAKTQTTRAKQRTPDGRLTITVNEVTRFPTGIFTWVYDASNPTPQKMSFDPETDGVPPPASRKLTFAAALAVVGTYGSIPAGAQALNQANDAVKAVTGADKVKIVIGLVLAAVSGFALGYKWAYVEKPDLQSKLFVDSLNDAIFWKSVQTLSKRGGYRLWVYDTSGPQIEVRIAPDGQPLASIPWEAIDALRLAEESALFDRLCKQEKITPLRPALAYQS